MHYIAILGPNVQLRTSASRDDGQVFFVGEPCTVDRYTEDYPFEGTITPLLLQGHTIGHTGYPYDKVLFAGDALYPKAVLERHKRPYSIEVDHTPLAQHDPEHGV